MVNVSSHSGTSRRTPLEGEEKADGVPGAFERLWGFFRRNDQDVTLRKSLEGVIEEHENSDEEMRDEERKMLLNILKFGALRIEDVMVPRADIKAVEETTTIEELLQIFTQAAHSRLPVFRETLDDPIGMVHIKDIIALITPQGEDAQKSNGKSAIARLRREVLFVPPSMPVVDLFLKMQATRIHMALVIDEYGGTDGLVTIEDLVEEIVGEIEDEHDLDHGPLLTTRPGGGYDADARLSIEALEEALGMVLLLEEWDEDIETLGGLVFSLAGRVPERGELIHHPGGLDFEVREADPRRIKQLRIYIDDLGVDQGARRVETQRTKPASGGITEVQPKN